VTTRPCANATALTKKSMSPRSKIFLMLVNFLVN
jgi:hypothetical protein